MTPELHPDTPHPDLDELILYYMYTIGADDNAGADAAIIDRVRLHLESCAECRDRIARLRGDIALLTMSAPRIAPPAGAKERLLRMANVPIAPEMETTAAPARPALLVPEGSGSGATSDSGNLRPMPARRRSPGLLWGGWVAAAACLLYAVQVRDSNRGMQQQLRTETAELVESNSSAARAREVMDVLSSPDAQRVTLISAHAQPEPTGHAVYLKDRGALVFTASNLAPLPSEKTYELWVIPANGTAPIPAGTFQPDARGMASLLLPKLPHGVEAKAFGVTMENAGGATTPTLPILLAGG